MPSSSPAQARLMQAVAHNPAFAKKVGIPQTVGQEFSAADAAQGQHNPALQGRRQGLARALLKAPR